MIKRIIIIVYILIPLLSFSDTANERENLLVLNNDFYLQLLRKLPVIRDDFLNSHLNRIVLCRGIVKSIDQIKRYKKKYRIVILDRDALKLKLNIKYFVFIDSRDSVSMITPEVIFEFSGQLMAYTQVNLKGNSYIFDIILEKGAIVVE